MLKELCNIDDYINFLFYGLDVESNIPICSRISAFRKKYNRLNSALQSTDIYQKTTAYILFNSFYSHLNDSPLGEYLNNSKMISIDSLFKRCEYNKLIYNDYISISFVETYVEDDFEWNNIRCRIYELLEKFMPYIHDDSNGSYRILSFDIPLINYDFVETYIEPDVTNYNIDIISAYLDILNREYDFMNSTFIDIDLNNRFISELKHYLSMDKDVLGGYFKFGKIINQDILQPSYLRKEYSDILQYISDESIQLLIRFQYKIFEYIFRKYSYFKEDDRFSSNLLHTFIAFDIILYNKSRQICDIEVLENIFSIYNFLIIKLQDLLDELCDSDKKIFVFMYKNQLYKSRNKIKERMKLNE